MRKITLLAFLFLSSFSVIGKSSTTLVDSLNQLITSSNNSSNIAKWKLEISWLTKSEDLNASIKIAETALENLEREKDIEGIAIAYSYLGVYHYLKKDYTLNLNYLLKAELLFKELENDFRLSKVYNNMGNTYSNLYDLPTAITYYNKALELKEKSPINADISPNLINIGTIYYNLGDYEKCIKLNERALVISFQNNDFESAAIIYSNLGASYERIGSYKKSINYLLKSLEIYQDEFINPEAEIRTYSNLGSTYLSLKELSDARFYFKHAISLNEELNSSSLQTILLNNLADVERQAGNTTLARSYVNQALKLASEHQDLEEESVAINELYLIEKDAGNFKTALTHYIKFIDLSDSLNDMYNVNQTRIALSQNEIELSKIQKEKDLLLLELSNKKSAILSLMLWPLLISVLLWLFLFIRNRSLNKTTQSLNFIIPLIGSAISVLFLFLKTHILYNYGVLVFFSIVLLILFVSIVFHLFLNAILSQPKKNDKRSNR